MKRFMGKALGILLSVTMMVSLVPGMAVLAATDEGGGEAASGVEDTDIDPEVADLVERINALPDEPAGVTDEIVEEAMAIRKIYWEMTDDQREEVGGIYEKVLAALYDSDIVAAEAVMELIENIGDVELTKECKEKIQSAEDAYESLDNDQRRYVKNYNDMNAAREKYSELEIRNVIDLIDKLPDPEKITLDDKSAVENASEAFHNLNQVQQKEVTNSDKLIACEEAIAKLEDEAEAKEVKAMIEALPDPEKVTLGDYYNILDAWDAYFELNEAQWEIIGDDLFDKLFKDMYFVELLDLQDTVNIADKLIDECSDYISEEKMQVLSEALEAAKKILDADEKSLIEIEEANDELIDALWDANLDVWTHYDIVEGANIVWLTGSDTSVKIRIKQLGIVDWSYDYFLDAGSVLLVDGEELPEGAAITSRGSLIIEIIPDFLKTLSVGEHKLTVKFDNDVTMDIVFTIRNAADVPASGESVSPAVYVGIAMVVLAAAGFVVNKRMAKKES